MITPPLIYNIFSSSTFSVSDSNNVVLFIFIIHIHTLLLVVCDVCRNLCQHPHRLVTCAYAFKPQFVWILWFFTNCMYHLNKWCEGNMCTTPNHLGLGYGKPRWLGLRTMLHVGHIQIYFSILTCNLNVVCSSLFNEGCQQCQGNGSKFCFLIYNFIWGHTWVVYCQQGTIQNHPIMYLASTADCCKHFRYINEIQYSIKLRYPYRVRFLFFSFRIFF